MRKVVSIVGARPQFIKAAVVSRALTLANVNDVLLHTGQHYDFEMSEVFFNELGLPAPQYSLGIGSGPHGRQTARMLEAIERALLDEAPEMVVTYGDTNSTLAGALAAAKLHIPVAHVEAGLRSFNRQMPEELNRVLTDHMADLLFAPTSRAVRNLKNEGICPERIIRTGDVMYDAAMKFAKDGEMVSGVLQRLSLQSGAYILATLHRSENTDNPERLRAILEGLAQITQDFPVVLPLHPRTRNELKHVRVAPEALQQLTVMEPVGYPDMAMLEKHARLIATDSGGVQKEAYFYGVTCVTLRGETEWIESMRRGCNTLAFPASAAAVAASVRKALALKPLFQSGIYGDGHSAEHIAKTIACWRPNKEDMETRGREHSFAGDQ